MAKVNTRKMGSIHSWTEHGIPSFGPNSLQWAQAALDPHSHLGWGCCHFMIFPSAGWLQSAVSHASQGGRSCLETPQAGADES